MRHFTKPIIPANLPVPAATFIRTIPVGVLYRCFCSLFATCKQEDWDAGIQVCHCNPKAIGFPKRDMTTVRFTRLVVSGWKGRDGLHHHWYCDCDCGTQDKAVSFSSLSNGSIRSCGCLSDEIRRSRRGKLKIDLTGQRYGRLLVIGPVARNGASRTSRWLCQCDCGRQHEASSSTLKDGKVASCGCLNRDSRVYDLTGLRFNNLVVEGLEVDLSKRGKSRWKVRCDCGNRLLVKNTSSLLLGSLTGCGCGLPSRRARQPGDTFNLFTLMELIPDDRALCRCQCGNVKEVSRCEMFNGSGQHSCGCSPFPFKRFDSLSQEFRVKAPPAAKAPTWERIHLDIVSEAPGLAQYVCLCGQHAFTSTEQFSKGISSCFCSGKRIAFPYTDLRGKTFGLLTVMQWIPEVTNSKGRQVRQYWKCKCACGTERIIKGMMLRDGITTSCGCQPKTSRVIPIKETTHGTR